jgi:hypothetical protein
MKTREFQPADEAALQRIRAAFDSQPLPPRPPDEVTIRRLNEIIKGLSQNRRGLAQLCGVFGANCACPLLLDGFETASSTTAPG